MHKLKIHYLWSICFIILMLLQAISLAVYSQKQMNYSYSEDIEIAGSLRKLSQEMLVNAGLYYSTQSLLYSEQVAQNINEFDKKIIYLLERDFPGKYVNRETELLMKQNLEAINLYWHTAKWELQNLTQANYSQRLETILKNQSKLLNASQGIVELLLILDEESKSKLIKIQFGIFIMISFCIGVAWYIIQNAWVKQERKNAHEKTELLVNIVRSLCKTLEIRDPYTYGHSERVAKMAKAVAREMGYSEEQCFQVELVGYLHDIGKIGTADQLLNKKGALTKSEYEEIKKHSELGASIVKEVLSDMIEGILYHHERFDGKGYPQQLEGEEIPEIARIITIVDAYDAMTSNRPYRNALDHEVAVKILEDNKGTQFDPSIIDVFLNISYRFDPDQMSKNSKKEFMTVNGNSL